MIVVFDFGNNKVVIGKAFDLSSDIIEDPAEIRYRKIEGNKIIIDLVPLGPFPYPPKRIHKCNPIFRYEAPERVAAEYIEATTGLKIVKAVKN